MTWLELVKNYFPDASDEECEFILWEKTLFPIGSLEIIKLQLENLKEKNNKNEV